MRIFADLVLANKALYNHLFFLISFPSIFYALSIFLYSLNSNLFLQWIKAKQNSMNCWCFTLITIRSKPDCFDDVLLLLWLTCPDLSWPIMTCPILSCPASLCLVVFCLVLSCPVLTCPDLSWPLLTCDYIGPRAQGRR